MKSISIAAYPGRAHLAKHEHYLLAAHNSIETWGDCQRVIVVDPAVSEVTALLPPRSRNTRKALAHLVPSLESLDFETCADITRERSFYAVREFPEQMRRTGEMDVFNASVVRLVHSNGRVKSFPAAMGVRAN